MQIGIVSGRGFHWWSGIFEVLSDQYREIWCIPANQVKRDQKIPNPRETSDVGKVSFAEIHIVSPNVSPSRQITLWNILEDNEVVIKMIIRSWSPTMRHVSRTHRVTLDWLFEKINLDPMIQVTHVVSQSQLAEILTKGSFTRETWTVLHHGYICFSDSHWAF